MTTAFASVCSTFARNKSAHLAALGFALLLPLGCSMGSVVWVENTEDMQIDAAGLKKLAVKTHNGSVNYSGGAGGGGSAGTIQVKVTKKAGGLTQADAEEALANLEVFNEADGADGRVINHRWKGIRKSNWNAQVSYEINGPDNLALNVDSHNGATTVRGLKSDLRVTCHNGRIDTESTGPSAHVESHNGAINVVYQGPSIHATTHNGQVTADLSRCAAIGGEIGAHNGQVVVRVGDQTSANLACQTHNGSVSVDIAAGWKVSHASRTRLAGVLGNGGQPLNVTTHNGQVRIQAN